MAVKEVYDKAEMPIKLPSALNETKENILLNSVIEY